MHRTIKLALVFLAIVAYLVANYYYPRELWFLSLNFDYKARKTHNVAIPLIFGSVQALIQVLFMNTFFNATDTVAKTNRKFEYWTIWLLPAFWLGNIASFYTTAGLAKSFEAEYNNLGNYEKKRPTYIAGMWANILTVAALVFYQLHDRVFSLLVFLSALAFFIVYWIQLIQTTRHLKALQLQGPVFSFPIDPEHDYNK